VWALQSSADVAVATIAAAEAEADAVLLSTDGSTYATNFDSLEAAESNHTVIDWEGMLRKYDGEN